MRFYVVKQDTGLKALGQALFKANRKSMTERLLAANPHVEAERIAAGSVLLLPDGGDAREAEAPAIDAAGFEAFAQEFHAAFRAAAERIRNDTNKRGDADKDAEKLLRSAAIRKLAESDETLRERLVEAAGYVHLRARDARDVAARLEAIEGGLMEEIGKLQRVFR